METWTRSFDLLHLSSVFTATSAAVRYVSSAFRCSVPKFFFPKWAAGAVRLLLCWGTRNLMVAANALLPPTHRCIACSCLLQFLSQVPARYQVFTGTAMPVRATPWEKNTKQTTQNWKGFFSERKGKTAYAISWVVGNLAKQRTHHNSTSCARVTKIANA